MPSLLTRFAFFALRNNFGFLGQYQIEQYAESYAIHSVITQLGIDCVLDVGANNGQFADRLRLMGFDGYIVSFEPNPEAFEKLSKRQDSKFIPYNLALSQTDGESLFHIPEHDVLGSFLTHRETDPVHSVKVKTRRLDGMIDEILERTGSKRLALKLDTQGFDLEVVRSAGKRMEDFYALLSEVSVTPLYDGMPHYLDSLTEYEELGFLLHSLHVVSRTKVGTPYEYNALMMRTNDI
jgi:FkbM family methyltransferase